ncbi:MAG: type III ribulose-bisphosphate carboxylase [Candidatus Diapherotrites archaeon]|nr:type III ribulose-bisphosphate carboxylase [Candidatus Diapherotrites archaeon]
MSHKPQPQYLAYIHEGYKPKPSELVCTFRVENHPSELTFREACGGVAAESSTGTWTKLTTVKPYMDRLGAKVYSIKGNTIQIAYPPELFETGSVPNILSSIAGNVFGLGGLKNLRLEDIYFPKGMVKQFKGPKFGIAGIRRFMKVKKRPLIGTVIKPKLGLNLKDHLGFCAEAWLGGCDFLKDDENLSNQKFNPFYERAYEGLKLGDKIEKETGEKKAFFLNITAETNEMVKRAEFIEKHGGKYVMVDFLTAGWAAFQTVRDLNLKCAIHCHRAQHAAFDRNPKHGIAMLSLARLVRLVGGDQLHVGTAVGKMSETRNEVLAHCDALRKPMHGLNQTLPVASGGLHPGHVPQLFEIFGRDFVIQTGGGIHGHPNGTFAGARALRQAVDAAMEKVPAAEYAKSHRELAAALAKWA